MKRLLLLLSWLLCGLPLAGQGIEGAWGGELEFGGNKLRLAFDITRRDSIYTGTMDSPDQGAKGMLLSAVGYSHPDVTFEMAWLKVLYKGVLQGDTLIVGTFNQSGMSFPLTLTRGKPAVNRPQEPKPPFPYDSEDVSFDSRSPEVVLAGTLTLPRNGSVKPPAVILVTGSGPQDRNEELFDHKPFLVIADYLTRNGVAVLRYDDRGVGGSTGDFGSATTADFLSDALGAFDYLQTRNGVDPGKIGILGHSEGGIIAFMAAAQNPDLGFIISLAGPGVRMDSLLIRQNEAFLLGHGSSQELVDAYCHALKKLYGIVRNESDEYITENRDRILTGIFESAEAYAIPKVLHKSLEVNLSLLMTPWTKYMMSLDPEHCIRQVKCPVFALNGSKDFQVDAQINLAAIERNLRAGGNSDYTVRGYEGLNHLFQQAGTGFIDEYSRIETTIDPQVLKDIGEWLNGRF